MTTKTAESVIGTCLTNLQKSYIELLEQNDVEGYAEVGRTLRHYVTNLAYISSNDLDNESVEEEGDFDFPH